MRDYLFFRIGRCYSKIKFSDILYVHADKKCVSAITTRCTYLVLDSLKVIEERLLKTIFCQVHRSYIISLDHTDKLDNEFAYISSFKIPISRRYRAVLMNAVGGFICVDQPFTLDNGDVDKLLGDMNT